MPAYAMVQMVDTSIAPPVGTYSAGASSGAAARGKCERDRDDNAISYR